jgi:hypothetical protein
MHKLSPVPLKEINGFPYLFQEWLRKLEEFVNLSGLAFSSLDFSGSNITSIASRRHEDLQALQGGNTNERFHLTEDQHDNLTSIPDTEIVFGDGVGSVQSDPNLKYDPSLNQFSVGRVRVNNAGGYISGDGSSGITTTITTGSLVGKTITIKDGIITNFA